jgi:hypothetical protein
MHVFSTSNTFWRVLISLVFGSLVLAPGSVRAAPTSVTQVPPTYVVDPSFRPQLTPAPAAGSAAAQAEIDELFAFDKQRTDDQYWRVIYWDRASAVGPRLWIELHAISAHN